MMPAELKQPDYLLRSVQGNGSIVGIGPRWINRRAAGLNNRPSRGGYGLNRNCPLAVGSSTAGPIIHPPQTTKDLVSRLKQESNLEGHSGCVNCLDWNQRGDLLASGSDDHDVIIWDPFKGVKRNVVKTGHRGNIFSVKFMPDFSDTYLATCASDGDVKLIDTLSQNVLMNCNNCHTDRVKRLAVHHNQPHLIWSAGEDGLIMQYDIRQEHRCSSQPTSQNQNYSSMFNTVKPSCLLIDLKANCLSMSAKCLAINPIRDELLAVGSTDIYTRLFDRRFIQRSSTNLLNQGSNISSPATAYFAPGHPNNHSRDVKPHSFGTTYLAFSPNGSELLVNMHAEQIYLFNIHEPHERYMSFETHLKPLILDHTFIPTNTTSFAAKNTNLNLARSNLKPHIQWEALRRRHEAIDIPPEHREFCHKLRQKLESSATLEMREFDKLNELLSMYKNCPELYQLRASGLLYRAWRGDYYQALRDSCCALALKPLCSQSLNDIARAIYWISDKESAAGLLKLIELLRNEYGNQDDLLSGAAETCVTLLRDSPCLSESVAMESDGELSYDSSSDNRDLPSPPLLMSESSMIDDEILFMPQMLVDDLENSNPDMVKEILKSQSRAEFQRRSGAFDYSERFCGHCNLQTDIKEANFFGTNGEFIVAGSDDGVLYIWDKRTGNIVKATYGDAQILNCVQPHPTICMLATSGIESTVKLWSTSGKTCRDIKSSNLEMRCAENQNCITAEPLDAMIMLLYPRTYN